MSREAMQMALDMLNEIADDVYCDQKLEGVIAALRQALETEQKTAVSPGKGTGFNYFRASQKTAVSPGKGTGFIDGVWYGPPQRKPLTDEQIIKHFQEHVDTGSLLSFADGVRFAEAAHGIKDMVCLPLQKPLNNP